MNLEMITEGLKQLLQENNYSSATIRFYEGEWNKIQCFLTEEYGNTEYDMERGLKYLEKQYGFITKYNNGTLSQQRVQLLRVVHMLEDYRLHQVLTRRYYASKNPITLNAYYLNLYTDYLDFLNSTELSASTIGHYKGISRASANISTISGFLHIFRRKGSPGKGADTMHIFTQMKNFKVFLMQLTKVSRCRIPARIVLM